MGIQCTRNFINTNASNAIVADYGVIPKYVIKRNEDAKKAQEEYDTYVRETLKQKAMKRLTEEERENLLEVHDLRNTATEMGIVSLDGALKLFYVVMC
ncbi:ENKUR: Enkurin [Crotalus adamanteus]|uniref:ENKUR: Enkurin n=1 Tax=Crotalus adamanteus TaxID=8729 RepID=A0AAW1B3Y0_CROAD